jgi:prepilin-type N-terminal cleavage/methylation domain-containing protein
MKKINNEKGFTLVELIVVLVILAILAAMLVPALLGFIDRAKEGKYEEEVHSIYTALQVISDERYAVGEAPIDLADHKLTTAELTELNGMIAPAKVSEIGDLTAIGYASTTDAKGKYTIATFTVKFDSQDGKTTGLTGELKAGSVSVTLPDTTNTNTNPTPNP